MQVRKLLSSRGPLIQRFATKRQRQRRLSRQVLLPTIRDILDRFLDGTRTPANFGRADRSTAMNVRMNFRCSGVCVCPRLGSSWFFGVWCPSHPSPTSSRNRDHGKPRNQVWSIKVLNVLAAQRGRTISFADIARLAGSVECPAGRPEFPLDEIFRYKDIRLEQP